MKALTAPQFSTAWSEDSQKVWVPKEDTNLEGFGGEALCSDRSPDGEGQSSKASVFIHPSPVSGDSHPFTGNTGFTKDPLWTHNSIFSDCVQWWLQDNLISKLSQFWKHSRKHFKGALFSSFIKQMTPSALCVLHSELSSQAPQLRVFPKPHKLLKSPESLIFFVDVDVLFLSKC